MDSTELLRWLSSLPPDRRDAAVDEHLGIGAATSTTAPRDHMIGYHASGVAPIVRALMDVPVVAEDVVIDLGAGLGKMVLLTRLLTGAAARGIEIQPDLVQRARATAARLAVEVTFTAADARDADLDDGTVFFLYVPFTGPVLAEVLRRLRAVAARRTLVVCALGVELGRDAPWLAPRARDDSFWLTIYDSVVPDAAPRRRSAPLLVGADARAIARDENRHG